MTAEFVAKKYGISREAQDLYALQSQQRTAQKPNKRPYPYQKTPQFRATRQIVAYISCQFSDGSVCAQCLKAL